VKIYVASSWRNEHQVQAVLALRAAGHEVYDFRNPAPGNKGFSWSAIDPAWKLWTVQQYQDALQHEAARSGFKLDMDALEECDVCVLVMPCGRSAHLELGYAIGAAKCSLIYIPFPERPEPELMYKMADGIFVHLQDVIDGIASYEGGLKSRSS
jgi:nucleoside 2-deoxyribosyltransferase